MTAAVHGPRVTQADRDAAALAIATEGQRHLRDAVRRGDYDCSEAVKAFARHREASQAELVEALEEARRQLEYIDERSPSGTTPAVLARINAALAKARTDATGDGA